MNPRALVHIRGVEHTRVRIALMDNLPLTTMAGAAASSLEGGGRVVDTYKKALTTAASVAAYAMLVRSMARELLPEELRAAVRWGAAFVRARLGAGDKERHTIVIRRHLDAGYNENHLFEAARAYLATKIDPTAMRRLCLARTRYKEPDGSSSWSTLLCMDDGGSTTDTFDGVEFKWTSIETGGDEGKKGKGHRAPPRETLELSFDAEHTEAALERYVPFIMSTAEQLQRRDRALKIFMNEGRSWHGINHHHPATFDTLAMDPVLKQAVTDDLDRFLKRKEYYRRIGKAWKRGYLLFGPPGTGKSSLVAAMANYLRFNLYDLDLSEVRLNSALQRLLIAMPNKSILVIEDIDCCFDAKSREDRTMPVPADDGSSSDDDVPEDMAHHPGPRQQQTITLSGLLNLIDGLWSTSGEERIIIFTTNYKDRLDPALLRPGRMDMHIYMGHCCWEAFKTLAVNYHLVDDHALFPEIQELLAAVEVKVTPAEVSEMLLRSEDADVALRVLTEFLQDKRSKARKEATEIKIGVAEKAM
ncbi:hypothetical protein CFC21_029321 [Triticum aestivum]|uniref:AAA+ ATPase domain-containing protein n=2 Tax=Triticum aestivum TaxID=4565 RepID=A0A9R1ET50_WHEAT|nr:AAA-ATPase At3g50940-like [Triticum aestivum]KAF7015482.1 hypothetical protein CFC21_029321 [Triticum aestivum]